ncbi:hypothetical protein HYT18_05015 [Candidatus Microgenomates bacterium]|nr:hypothetical protein [Candidatus Microgenomates bacterium]
MLFFLKNTQTSIGSCISSIPHNILIRIKPKDQGVALFFILVALFYSPNAYAITDPLAVPNNKFGIHIIQATPDESSPAAQMVNNNGDWGYITFLIESKDRNEGKWQEFFNDLRRRHLIPLVRLATKPLNEHWERPYDGEEEAWAGFLDNLNWPIKNRYVIVYNEPNHGKEWGNFVDPKMYAKVLDKTITALKNKNRDFFVLNGGLDASAPHQPPLYFDEVQFLKEMEKEVPGILNKLDGWVSHSYPNPGFVGSPFAIGRGTVRGWFWELQQLRNLGVTKNLPVFITETGWKHAEGISLNPTFPSAELVGAYYRNAFENAWNSNRIVAVTPFLLSYQELPFDHFSFKKITGEKQPKKLVENQVLGIQYPQYYPQYQTLADLPKTKGKPVQENKAQLIKGEVYSSIVSEEGYKIFLTFKNTGQSIWSGSTLLTTSDQVRLFPLEGGKDLGIEEVALPEDKKVEPGQEHTFILDLKAPEKGMFKVVLNLFSGSNQFDSQPLEFETEVKSPVILKITSTLKWKEIHAGEYLLSIEGATGDTIQKIILSEKGESAELEVRYLLPDYTFDFTLEKPFYKSKTIRQRVSPGINTLDFGILEPDIISALLKPKELWNLLPFSN